METTPTQLEVDAELRSMTAEQIRAEKASITSQLRSLQDQIGDLAFSNYRTYADAGRTTEHCTQILTDMSTKLSAASAEIPAVAGQLKGFFSKTKDLENELTHLRAASDPANPIWDILSLPNRMDVCIRAGFYEAAYSLTNYGLMLQQHGMTKNKVIKEVADRLVASRAFLLEELFNKFAGPIDLTTSIQVVNNIRKMPYLSPTQLRVAILHYRDVYLDKQIMEIANEPEAAFKAVEIFRDSMYDTMVLYLAVFPESEVVKKDPTRDPRWEPWPTASPQAILGEWATRNVDKLMDIVTSADYKSMMELSTIYKKLLSFGQSFGRMGLDFRPKVVEVVHRLALSRFKGTIKKTTSLLVAHSGLDIVTGSVQEVATEASADPDAPPVPGAELSLWDDVCVYGNGIIEALNDLRYMNSPVMLKAVRATIIESLRAVAEWMGARATSAHFPRAVALFATQLVPFFEACLRTHFPYASYASLFGASYMEYIHLDPLVLLEGCSNAEDMEKIATPLVKKKVVANVAEVLKKTERPSTVEEEKLEDVKLDEKPVEEEKPSKFEESVEVEIPLDEPEVSKPIQEKKEEEEDAWKEDWGETKPTAVVEESSSVRFSIEDEERQEEWGWDQPEKKEKSPSPSPGIKKGKKD